ncbi:E1 ubiquitin-activating protein aos1 [Coemansia sp. RSA 1843]|nr:E1 ubiquitin-activating protein aos1 [Coemansia sp. RSA 1843]
MTMANTRDEDIISKEEVALYDRQIRLWGVEAQTRLRKASICVVGVNTATLEMCKNLVLAGLGGIGLCDPRPIGECDLETQYYFGTEDVGKRKDVVLAERLALLNPLVHIEAASIDGLQWVDKYDLVVAVGNVDGLPAMREINATCRDAGKQFIGADAFGLFGYIFADCLDAHEYVEEVKGADEGDTSRQVLRASYKSLDQSCAASLNITNLKRSLRKYPPLVFICQALALQGDKRVLGETELSDIINQSIQGRGIPDGMVDEALIGRVATSWGTEFVPCASVVGGTLAQEVLKVVTGKDMPVNNWFVYDAIGGDGIQCTI